MTNKSPKETLKPVICSTEKDARIQLAATCHLIDYYGWSDSILNHCSARVPRESGKFLMNPYGLMYNEVTASNLSVVPPADKVLEKSQWPASKPGSILHSTIYEAREDINCIIHTHTEYGVAVSMLEEGLICEDQMAMLFHDNIGYHEFEGIVINEDEKLRIKKSLGNNKCLILRNHGLVATGRSIAEAFWNYYYLEFACKVQILAKSSSMKLNKVKKDIKNTARKQHDYFCSKQAPTAAESIPGNYDVFFNAHLRLLDKLNILGAIEKDELND